MIRQALCGAWWLVGAPLAALDATGRWSLQVRGPVAVDRGDLRIAGDTGRLLLESSDSSWLPVRLVRSGGTGVTLVAGGTSRFVGTLEGETMRGTLRSGDGPTATWEAQRIQPGTSHWPVRPRVVVRQMVIGRDDSVAIISDAWRSRILPHATLLAEHAALATEVGFPPGDLAAISGRAQRIVLGLDPVGRDAARRQLERIAGSPAADAEFFGLFRLASGTWRIDLHDAAWQNALARVGPAALDPDSLTLVLARLGMRVDREAGALALVQAVWQLWSRSRGGIGAATDGLPREAGGRGLAALMSGYDDALAWWRRAVDWLLRNRWLAVDDGWRSPAELVAQFWERESLTLPAIEPQHFGSMQAVPVIGGARLADVLLRPANAIATEFLGDADGRRDAMAAWRRLESRDSPPLRIVVGPQQLTLGAPATLTRSRLGGFLASEPAIRIEPGIVPIFAVGTVVHEWQHLLFEAERMEGPRSPAIREAEWGIRLVEADPWLGEGAAEWATEQVLAPARTATPLFTLVEAEKRLSIGAGLPEDTHVLGYLLVRAAHHRLESAADLRRLLVAELHDPVAFASAIGLAGPATQRIPRPPTLVLIPEMTFIVDGGVADGATRRLIVPAMPVEP